MRHFLTVREYCKQEILDLLQLAKTLKSERRAGTPHPLLAGKTLAMIFQKPSNRTRVSFEVGIYQLGGAALIIKEEEIGMGKRETIADVSRVLSRYVDAVMIRPFFHSDIEEFAKYSAVPVINGLSDLYHPCQVCADMLTVLEHKQTLEGLRICYVGDGNNVCNSLIAICDLLDIELIVCCPPHYEPTITIARYSIVYDPYEAVKGADVVYTDVWVSMGPADQEAHGISNFVGYTVSSKLMKQAKPDAIFMHCLPAHRGEEVDADVVEGPQSVIFDQAENRLHAQKAILVSLLQHG